MIDITGEITELPIPALKALTERYRCKHDVKVHEQQWLDKLKQAAHLKIQALAEPYKSQRKKLFDANFKELD